LTLKFIGEAEDKDLPLIKKAMDIAASSRDSFRIKYGSLGVFPSLNKARVIWAGLEEGSSELQNIAAILENSLADHSFKPEKRQYYPHLTLGRLRFSIPENRIRTIIDKEKSFTTSESEADELLLFNSSLSRQGPLYTQMHQSILSNTGTGELV
jgi:RNA 2',3'-cyclic 3'-phosphodiesterase